MICEWLNFYQFNSKKKLDFKLNVKQWSSFGHEYRSWRSKRTWNCFGKENFGNMQDSGPTQINLLISAYLRPLTVQSTVQPLCSCLSAAFEVLFRNYQASTWNVTGLIATNPFVSNFVIKWSLKLPVWDFKRCCIPEMTFCTFGIQSHLIWSSL